MPRRRQAILLAYLTLGAFFVAHSINAFVSQALIQPITSQALPVTLPVSPPVPMGSARLAEEIVKSGLFVSGQAPVARVEGVNPQATPLDAAKKIKLVGTVVAEGMSALAVLEDVQSKKQLLYHLYDQIPDVGQIVEIRRDGIMVQEGQHREFVALQVPTVGPVPAPSVAAAQPAMQGIGTRAAKTQHTLDRRLVAQSMADVPKLLTQAQAAPFYQEGKLAGWKIESIKSGSFYEQIGLQAGDVLQRVNGVEVRDPGMMLTLFQQVKDESQVKLDLLRDTQRTTLSYDIR